MKLHSTTNFESDFTEYFVKLPSTTYFELDFMENYVKLRKQRKISSFVNLDVLDVGFQRAKKVFRIWELGCARCGFSETKDSFQVL